MQRPDNLTEARGGYVESTEFTLASFRTHPLMAYRVIPMPPDSFVGTVSDHRVVLPGSGKVITDYMCHF